MALRARIFALVTALSALFPLAARAETLHESMAVSAVVVSSVAASYDSALPPGQRLALTGGTGALDLASVGLYVQGERYLDASAAESAIEAQLRVSHEPVVVSLVF